MESLLHRAATLSVIALFLVACAGALDPWGTSDLRELRQLPLESKIYFRNGISIPARTQQVWLASEPGTFGMQAHLTVTPSEKDRFIDSVTPLLLNRIETPQGSGACAVTLNLVSPGGLFATLRASRRGPASRCTPLTIGDLESAALVVVSPPVPIQ